MKWLIAIKWPRLNPIEDHQGRTRGHIWTHLDAAISIRRWKINDSAIKSHDREIVAYDRETMAYDCETMAYDRKIVAYDREIMPHDREIVGYAWSRRSSSNSPQLK